jgi:hypothetical protein
MPYAQSMLTLTLSVLLHVVPQSPAPEPTAANLEQWLTFIQPSASEESYRDIGWRNALSPAVAEARRLGRPILLWTMNGHPLGCT